MADTIELTITVAGKRWYLCRDLPRVVRASTGPMSIRSGIEPVTDRMLRQAIEELVDEAVSWITRCRTREMRGGGQTQ